MFSKEQHQVANAIASAFLASCLVGGATFTAANAATMGPAEKTQSGMNMNKTRMMGHGCSSKHKAKKQNGMMSHGCSGKAKK